MQTHHRLCTLTNIVYDCGLWRHTEPSREDAIHMLSFVYVTLTEPKCIFDDIKIKHVEISY